MIVNITDLVKNILLLVLSIATVLIFVEIVFRIFGIQPNTNENIMQLSDNILKTSDNPRLLYTYKENIPNLTNSYGFHDKEYSLKKQDNKIRIIVLGDSVTYGVGESVSIDKNFLHILEDEIKNVEIINMAHSGYNTTQEVELFKIKGLQFKPDIVLVFYVLNDPVNDSIELSILGKEHLLLRDKLRKIPFLGWLENYSSFWNFTMNSILSMKIRLKVESIIGNNTESYYQHIHNDITFDNVISEFKTLKNMSQQYNFTLRVFIIPELVQPDKYINTSVHLKVKKSLNNIGIDVVDMLPIIKVYPPSKMRLGKHDNLHLNVEGHRIFANWLKPYIKEEILNYNKM